MIKFKRLLTSLSVVFLCGFTMYDVSSQPKQERLLQNSLPQSYDNLWQKLFQSKVQLNPKKHTYSIEYTPYVKSLENKNITISGFIFPLESSETFKHFLLSKRTPTCNFCPPGEPNEIIEVFTDNPIKWDENIVKISGILNFTSDENLGVFFQIKNATLIP